MVRPGACAVVAILAVFSACDDGSSDTAPAVPVALMEVLLSQDRLTITVRTSYPVERVFCAKEPAGLSIDFDEDSGVALVDARMTSAVQPDQACTMECGWIDQTTTLDRPLPATVTRFEAVPDAVPGCADNEQAVSTTTTTTFGSRTT